MTGRRGGRPLVPAYVSTGGRTRPSRNSLERLSVLTGLTTCPEDPAPGAAPVGGAGPPLPAGPAATATAAPAAAPPAAPDRQHTPEVPPDLPAAQRSLLTTLDGGSLTVVETAALLELPVSAVRVLAGHLVDLGLVTARPPIPYAVKPDPDLLERVADGLRALKL
ncbi:DUF742 domain-containing protein [Streptomyces clavuligerus]|uniref:DUF742 domain-containing protein n=7 Tax=Streptomyces clavuligerus TaxID=1901 RepID=E2Q038_STRCL|nr:DUF742 domain-containing protein [Streptomyces clavuligerus]ANW18850.1 hypothetical protein BB341_11730 [Streptomyces clavuligerus]AXU13421.1 DUF742 domain-containing protein [Streptomyces clavuligerus]EFG08457.1 DUF742 domain-containing protein [Streptomyces clavuligerus]MBY6303382.1 DUF742 domain-containing protein [Streptomyces clavuligerus]QCS06204.1 DUF742 domain-containing protein [Streptomyces clavuligerus]